MTSVSGPRISASGAVGRVGGGNGARGAAATLNAIASDVAATIAGELRLAEVDPDARRKPDGGQDRYGIEEAAAELAASVNATPSEAGEIARLLHAFAAEVAARVGAIPDARCIEEVGRLVARCTDDTRDARDAILLIADAVRRLAA